MARSKKQPVHKGVRRKKKRSLTRRIIYFLSILGVIGAFLLLWRPIVPTSECANSISCISNLSGKYDKTQLEGEFQNTSINAPLQLPLEKETRVLGVADAERKRIEVDLTNQRLYAYENDAQIFSFPISSGTWGKTPTGEFRIWIKLRYTRMQGGSRENGTYYNLPNVPHTMFFYNDKIPKWRGFGIHGAYWHNNFGHPMSHGCINMALPDVEKLYNWATPDSTGHTTHATAENPGTKIIIYGKAPNY